jgi:hypothetical protein
VLPMAKKGDDAGSRRLGDRLETGHDIGRHG